MPTPIFVQSFSNIPLDNFKKLQQRTANATKKVIVGNQGKIYFHSYIITYNYDVVGSYLIVECYAKPKYVATFALRNELSKIIKQYVV